MANPKNRITTQKRRRTKGTAPAIHKERMARANAPHIYIEPQPRLYGVGEAEIVPGYQLSEILRRWVVEWLADRPRNHTPMGVGVHEIEEGDVFMGPVDWLAEKTEINVRRVQGFVNGDYATVGLSQADAVLTAIGHNVDYLNNTGEIMILPNPNWSQEKWIAYMEDRGCC